MSREVKFRGGFKDDGTWVFGSYVRTTLVRSVLIS